MTRSTVLTDDLKAILARGPRDVVVVVGAGVTIGALGRSPSARLATWKGLLEAGLGHVEELGLAGAPALAEIRGLLATDDPQSWIAAATAMTAAMGGGELRAWLRRTVGAFAGQIEDRGVLDALRELQRRGAILATVNYDGLLEEATGLRAVTWRDRARVERVIRGEEQAILHLHGYWEDPDSVVFGEGSYQEVVHDAHARAVREALRLTKTFLFVGHGAGLKDPNWGNFLRWTEQVFADSEFRHYRLVKEDERERVQAEHGPGQRITALVYGRSHDELAPFLRTLVPAGAAAPTGTAERAVILLVNIGERDHGWLSKDEARVEAREPEAECFEVAEVLDRRAITARQWRVLARKIDEQVKQVLAVRGVGRYVIAGQAPLPVFAYLGYKMQSARGKKRVINFNRDKDKWETVGPLDEIAGEGRELFTIQAPLLGRERRGWLALSIQCSNKYEFKDEWVEPNITAEGGTLLGSYTIHNEQHSHTDVSLEDREMPVIRRHLDGVLVWMKRERVELEGLVVALGGPSWAAFWVGNHLNRNVASPRIDFPNRVPGQGYARALSSPMHKAPWLDGKAKLMFIGAEPDNTARTRGAKTVDAIQGALEREVVGADACEVRVKGAVTVKEFLRELDVFKPDILHMHLHGTAEGPCGLVFEDEQRTQVVVPAEAVIEMLRATKVAPALVVLSACNSEPLAPLLDEIAECVVSMNGEVGYAVLIDFSSAFYGALARGRSLAEAIAQGKSAVHGRWGRDENEKIGWRCAPGVEPSEEVLLPRRAR